jgi:hypothetical protein
MDLKAYVQRWEERDSPHVRHLEYFFTSSPENAATWPAKDEADIDCKWFFERGKIRIPSAQGGYHICSGFRSEERRPGEFVVFCEAPFIRK